MKITSNAPIRDPQVPVVPESPAPASSAVRDSIPARDFSTLYCCEWVARLEREFLERIKKLAKFFSTAAKSAKLYFKNEKGEYFMDVSVHLNDTPLAASLVEYDGPNGTGNIVPSVGPTSF